jgi:hypothetical protein
VAEFFPARGSAFDRAAIFAGRVGSGGRERRMFGSFSSSASLKRAREVCGQQRLSRDLVARFRADASLAEPDDTTFYSWRRGIRRKSGRHF